MINDPKEMPMKIRNTSAEATTREGASAMLLEAIALGSGAIEAQEARGQKELCASVVLPAAISGYRDTAEELAEERAPLEAAGVRFGEPVAGDPLFVHVELPPGWALKPTDHAMWSKLCDEKGRERAAIFYKAAFYDRSAHFSATPRFRANTDDDDQLCGVALDAGVEIWRSAPFREHAEGWKNRGAAHRAASAWLAEHRPGWEDPAAYWNEAGL